MDIVKFYSYHEWFPPYSRLYSYHDCYSPTTSRETAWLTVASQTQSPAEADPGDGKSNELLCSCPAYRNELGNERIRKPTTGSEGSSPASSATTVSVDAENCPRVSAAAIACGALEDSSNVYFGGRQYASRETDIVSQDPGSYYFRHCFVGRPHIDYFGMDNSLGPVAVSVVMEAKSDRKDSHCSISTAIIYRMIVRVGEILTVRVAVPESVLSSSSAERSPRTLVRDLLAIVCPQVNFGCLRPAIASPRVDKLLLNVDEQSIQTRHKIGVLLCRAGQSTEQEMYNNEHSSPAFDEFLDFIGRRVRLKNFDAYRGGLDTREDTTGEYSIYTEYFSHEIMFHVSTMLPFTPDDRQQLWRKRHIGNDMVTIVFQEPGALPFNPRSVRSHFQHVFIVVRVRNSGTDDLTYDVAVSRAIDVPPFGPPIASDSEGYRKSVEFHDFLLTKIINAEIAIRHSSKFAAMAGRARRAALTDLAENHVNTQSSANCRWSAAVDTITSMAKKTFKSFL